MLRAAVARAQGPERGGGCTRGAERSTLLRRRLCRPDRLPGPKQADRAERRGLPGTPGAGAELCDAGRAHRRHRARRARRQRRPRHRGQDGAQRSLPGRGLPQRQRRQPVARGAGRWLGRDRPVCRQEARARGGRLLPPPDGPGRQPVAVRRNAGVARARRAAPGRLEAGAPGGGADAPRAARQGPGLDVLVRPRAQGGQPRRRGRETVPVDCRPVQLLWPAGQRGTGQSHRAAGTHGGQRCRGQCHAHPPGLPARAEAL